MRTIFAAVLLVMLSTQALAADGIPIELLKDHPIVSRLTTPEVRTQTCGQPVRVQVIVQRFATSTELVSISSSKTELIDLQANEINDRITQVNKALASYPKPRQIERLSAGTREKILAAADRKLKGRLDRCGAALLVGIDKQRLSDDTLLTYDRLGVVTDASTLGLCKVPPK